MTKVVGLTGGIGSGKSSVLQLFIKKGVVVYIADIEAKNLMNNDKKLIKLLISQFGENTYENGKLNRKYLADKVFTNKKQLQILNAIVHPAVQKHFKKFIKNTNEKFIIYENAILFENGFDLNCDVIITVTAPLNERLERVIQRDSLTKEQVLQRMKNQWDEEKKIERSHYVIYNINWEETVTQFEEIYQKLSALFKS